MIYNVGSNGLVKKVQGAVASFCCFSQNSKVVFGGSNILRGRGLAACLVAVREQVMVVFFLWLCLSEEEKKKWKCNLLHMNMHVNGT